MKVISFILTLVLVGQVHAGAGTTAFSFLRVEQGARAAAMGGAFSAMADDLNALWWNPGGLTSIKNRTVSTSYRNYLLDCQSGVAAYGLPALKGVVAGAVSYDYYGTNERWDENGVQDGTFGVSSLTATAGYALPLALTAELNGMKQDLSVGTAVKLAYMNIDGYSSTGLAVDLGVKYRLAYNKGVSVGAGVRNLGVQLNPFIDERESLPLTFRLGVSYPPQHLPLTLSLEAVKPLETPAYVAFGGEFALMEDKLFLRGGISQVHKDEWNIDPDKDGMAGISLGAGFKAGAYTVDYAFTPAGQLGSVNRFSFTGSF